MAEVSASRPRDSAFTSTAPPPPPPLPTLTEREQIRIEFYKTYDVMTGVRIAATLGGFFGLMVLLVIYKSKCKSRSLSDQHLEAAVTAVIEEEEELALNALNLYGPRRSLGNMSAPTAPYPRFSSLGGHSLLNPPTRVLYGQRARVSIPSATTPSPQLTLTSPPLKRPYPEEEEDDDYPDNFLQVPSRRASRRLSSITCSSADSSYLERRGSAVEMGRPPPPALRRPPLPHEHWDFYYPIDIQVIQPTPLLSPCTSEGTLYDHPRTDAAPALSLPRQAPLASISSCQVSSAPSPALASDCHSVGSDSVFLDEECMDTEDEAEEFSTDSDVDDYGDEKRQFDPRKLGSYSPSSVPFAEHLQMSNYPKTMAGRFHGAQPIRRYSSPSHRSGEVCGNPPACSTSCDTFADNNIASRPPLPLPSDAEVSGGGVTPRVDECRPRPVASLSCDHLVRALSRHETSSVRDLVEHCSWSQETLF
ncbi:hypothetical protein J6590_052020 [Homalodisca vitripennis]|nr:hypothetical protein J6590_052020 [Homalodisca vitripennis]